MRSGKIESLCVCPWHFALTALLYLTRSNSFSACSPEKFSSKTRPLGSSSCTRKVRSEPSRPGINSALNTTSIPGRAQMLLSRSVRRLLLPLIIKAPIAPIAPAATATPPNRRFVLVFIAEVNRRLNSKVDSHLGKSTREGQLQQQPAFPHKTKARLPLSKPRLSRSYKNRPPILSGTSEQAWPRCSGKWAAH
jgi:hypothetical protein